MPKTKRTQQRSTDAPCTKKDFTIFRHRFRWNVCSIGNVINRTDGLRARMDNTHTHTICSSMMVWSQHKALATTPTVGNQEMTLPKIQMSNISIQRNKKKVLFFNSRFSIIMFILYIPCYDLFLVFMFLTIHSASESQRDIMRSECTVSVRSHSQLRKTYQDKETHLRKH